MIVAKRVAVLMLGVLWACGDDGDSDDVPDPVEKDAQVDAARLDAGPAQDARVEVVDARVPQDARAPEDAGKEGARDAGVLDAATDAGFDAGQGVARGLDALTLEAPCAANTPLPLAQGATCAHREAMRLTRTVTLAGDPARVYQLRLRIRGIWEPTSIAGGMHDAKLPVTVGGEVAKGTGDPINYQQWSIQVAKPAQTYWLNDYRYVAHDIHKEDYETVVRANGGSKLAVTMNDGNDHQIANWTKDSFPELNGGKPATGQLLRIDVLSVE